MTKINKPVPGDTHKSSNAKDELLILMTDDGIIIRSTHPDFWKVGYAVIKTAKEKLSIANSIESFLQGMIDALREEASA